jgi:thiamine-phosphate diphosphorylase
VTNRHIPRLHLIGPLGVVEPEQFIDVAAAAVRGGCDAVHLRLPGARTSEVLPLARLLRERLAGSGVVVLVNDRPDVALIAGCGGVQLPETGFSVADARLIAGEVLIGRSVHDDVSARDVARQEADFLVVGHIFDTGSKLGTPGRGLTWLHDISGATHLPVIAIGGITTERIPEVLAAGAHGVALGRELLMADDPEQTAREARGQIDTFLDERTATDAAD